MERIGPSIRTFLRRLAVTASCVLAVWLLSAALAAPRAHSFDDDAMKSAYIYNIIKFVEWPEAVVAADTNAGTTLCVLGDEKVIAMANYMEQRQINQKPIRVRKLTATASVSDCRILFISRSEAWQSKKLIAELSSQPILTIGEAENFAKEGGMIQFLVVDQRLGFEINHGAIVRAGLRIRAQLLALAKTVYR